MHNVLNKLNELTKKSPQNFLRLLLLKQHEFFGKIRTSMMSWYRTQILVAQVTSAGAGLKVGPYECTIRKFGNASIDIGENVNIYSPVYMTATSHIFPHAAIEIGDRTRIGRFSEIRAAKKVKIGKDCLIAKYVRIFDYNGHPLSPGSYDQPETLRNRSKTPPQEVGEINIGDNVWIGDNAFIQRGVTIGNGAIISANSVVIKDVPEKVVVFGAPARVILWLEKKDRNDGELLKSD